MNRTKNDLGEWVVSVGAKNSIERLKVEFPGFIKTCDEWRAEFNSNCYPDERFSWINVEILMKNSKMDISNLEGFCEILGLDN